MKAIVIRENGGSEVLRYEDVTLAEPGPGEVRVAVEYAGVNFIDIYQRKGLYKGQLPRTLGVEGAGRIVAVGPGVSETKPGDRVGWAMQDASYAKEIIIRSSVLVPIPDEVDLRIAAAVLLQGMTAQYLATSTYPLGGADTALVHAAAGGTGRLLVQIARIRGATVIGTASTEEKARLALEAGARDVIRYTQTDFEIETRRLTGGRGVDVVYDSVGQATFEKSLGCLRPRGMMVLFGQSSGPVPPQDLQILNRKGSLYVTRPTLGHYIADRTELLERARDVFRWIAEGALAVRVDKVFPLADAAKAHDYLESRLTTGKVLLQP